MTTDHDRSTSRAVTRTAGNAAARPGQLLDTLGRQMAFYGRTFGWFYRVLLRYRKEVVRLLAEVTLGRGALAVIGGTVAVSVFLTFIIGVETGLQAFKALEPLGVAALSAFLTTFTDTREGVPVITGFALTATVGAGFTSQLGAMRINEEIDALEVMAVPSIPFLVTTRVVAGLVAVIPLYAISLIACYTGGRLILTVFFGQALGTYVHYFNVFLIPIDIVYSFIKVLLMAVVVMLICCYYGFNATGGPAGVGTAVGRAVRASLVAVCAVDLIVGVAIYGGQNTVDVAG